MRATKRQIEALKQIDAEEAKEALKKARKRLREQDEKYRKFNEEHGLKAQNWRREIVKNLAQND